MTNKELEVYLHNLFINIEGANYKKIDKYSYFKSLRVIQYPIYDQIENPIIQAYFLAKMSYNPHD